MTKYVEVLWKQQRLIFSMLWMVLWTLVVLKWVVHLQEPAIKIVSEIKPDWFYRIIFIAIPFRITPLWHTDLLHCSIQNGFLTDILKNNMVGFFPFYLHKLIVFYLFLPTPLIPPCYFLYSFYPIFDLIACVALSSTFTGR